MKKLAALTLCFLLLTGFLIWRDLGTPLSILPDVHKQSAQNISEPKKLSAVTETRAVWVATAYSIDYPSEPTTDAEALKTRCTAILDAVKANGCNTVYLQVRPAADSIYPSSIFPWSKYLTGTCGSAPENAFDPLTYWVEQAHERDIKLEAWVNPYRICAGQYADSDFSALPDSSPAKQHPEWVVSCDGGYYFNPAIPEVRALICDGVQEIVSNYAVDGIQFDDYFYPSTEFDDAQAYAAYDGDLNLEDWRRDNVNQLIQQVHEIVQQKSKNSHCMFGISPSGIWRNRGINVFNGSDTNGYEHYSSAYADSLTWIQQGWIDYICPQIYWEIGDSSADFKTLAEWWNQQVSGTKVSLILGLAGYKIGDSNYGAVWETGGCAEIGRQIDLLRTLDNINGFALFSYQNLENTDGLSAVLTEKCSN